MKHGEPKMEEEQKSKETKSLSSNEEQEQEKRQEHTSEQIDQHNAEKAYKVKQQGKEEEIIVEEDARSKSQEIKYLSPRRRSLMRTKKSKAPHLKKRVTKLAG